MDIIRICRCREIKHRVAGGRRKLRRFRGIGAGIRCGPLRCFAARSCCSFLLPRLGRVVYEDALLSTRSAFCAGLPQVAFDFGLGTCLARLAPRFVLVKTMNRSVSRVPGLSRHAQVATAPLVPREQVTTGKLGGASLGAALSVSTSQRLEQRTSQLWSRSFVSDHIS